MGLALADASAVLHLYGTRTSPYVRRVRVVARMVGAPIELIDTSTDDGQLQLQTVTPIWKVPVLDGEDKAIFDSRVIVDYLLRRHGNRNLRTDSGVGRWREANLVTALDGALDAAINCFYLERDGGEAKALPYLQKQRSRVSSVMSWIDKQLDGAYFTDVHRIGLSEVSLVCTLDWMRFRKTYDVDAHESFVKFLEAHDSFEPFVATRPPGG